MPVIPGVLAARLNRSDLLSICLVIAAALSVGGHCGSWSVGAGKGNHSIARTLGARRRLGNNRSKLVYNVSLDIEFAARQIVTRSFDSD